MRVLCFLALVFLPLVASSATIEEAYQNCLNLKSTYTTYTCQSRVVGSAKYVALMSPGGSLFQQWGYNVDCPTPKTFNWSTGVCQCPEGQYTNGSGECELIPPSCNGTPTGLNGTYTWETINPNWQSPGAPPCIQHSQYCQPPQLTFNPETKDCDPSPQPDCSATGQIFDADTWSCKDPTCGPGQYLLVTNGPPVLKTCINIPQCNENQTLTTNQDGYQYCVDNACPENYARPVPGAACELANCPNEGETLTTTNGTKMCVKTSCPTGQHWGLVNGVRYCVPNTPENPNPDATPEPGNPSNNPPSDTGGDSSETGGNTGGGNSTGGGNVPGDSPGNTSGGDSGNGNSGGNDDDKDCNTTNTCNGGVFAAAEPGTLEAGIADGYDLGAGYFCGGQNCDVAPSCETGLCNSSERLDQIKQGLFPGALYAAGQCPAEISIDLSDYGLGNHQTDVICTFLEQNRGFIQGLMTFFSILAFVLIVLEA